MFVRFMSQEIFLLRTFQTEFVSHCVHLKMEFGRMETRDSFCISSFFMAGRGRVLNSSLSLAINRDIVVSTTSARPFLKAYRFSFPCIDIMRIGAGKRVEGQISVLGARCHLVTNLHIPSERPTRGVSDSALRRNSSL